MSVYEGRLVLLPRMTVHLPLDLLSIDLTIQSNVQPDAPSLVSGKTIVVELNGLLGRLANCRANDI